MDLCPSTSGLWHSLPYNIYTALNLSSLKASERRPRNYFRSCYLPSSTDILLILLWRLFCEAYHIFHSAFQPRIRRECSSACSGPLSPLGTFSNILQYPGPRTEFSPWQPSLYPLTGCYGNSEAYMTTPCSINQLFLGLLTWKRLQRVVWVGVFFWFKNKKHIYQVPATVL